MNLSFQSKPTLTVLKAATNQELLTQIKSANPDHLLHIRLDQITDFTPDCLTQIKPVSADRMLMVSFRSPKAGGHKIISKDDWRIVMEQIISIGFHYVEIEMPSVMDIDLSKKSEGTKIIVCYADSAQTPGYRNLRKLQKRMRGFNPDIQSFDTRIKNNDDLQNLVRLLVSKKKSDNLWVNFKELPINEVTLGNLFSQKLF